MATWAIVLIAIAGVVTPIAAVIIAAAIGYALWSAGRARVPREFVEMAENETSVILRARGAWGALSLKRAPAAPYKGAKEVNVAAQDITYK